MKIRLETIGKLLNLYTEFVTKYPTSVCKLEKDECSSMLYGSIMLPLIRLNIWPPMNFQVPQNYSASINYLSSPLATINIHILKDRNISNHACGLFQNEIRSSVTKILDEIPSPLLESHRRHFQQKQ